MGVESPDVASWFAGCARSLTDPVREGLRFGLNMGILTIVDDGRIRSSLPVTSRPPDRGDLRAVVRSAGLVGKWFAKLDQPATSFALLGVAP